MSVNDIYLPKTTLSATVLFMEMVAQILPWFQVLVSILLILTILLQQSGAGVGGALGGGDSALTYRTRRGFEKVLFVTSIILAILFFVSALAAVFI